MVLKKQGEDLYTRVKKFEKDWFEAQVIPAIFRYITPSLVTIALDNKLGYSVNHRRDIGEKFLRHLRDSWTGHDFSMNMVADILMYLDRGYAHDSKQASIYTVTIGLYRDYILRRTVSFSQTKPAEPEDDRTICQIINAVIVDLINIDRSGEVVDRSTLRACVAMLETLYETDAELEGQRLYQTTFEDTFLASSQAFFRAESQKLLQGGDAHTWLHHTQRRLLEEEDRCKTTISMLTTPKILQVVERELIISHLQEFVMLESTGLRAMIDNDRREDLAILYQLIARVDPAKTVLKNALSSRIIELGKEIEEALKNTDFSVPTEGDVEPSKTEADKTEAAKTVSAAAQQTAAAIKWVSDILALKDKFDGLWEDCFESDLILQTGLTHSFTELFRLSARSPEYVSLFIDDNFKRGLRGKSDAEVDRVLEKATVMIRHLTERDMFERYYQKHLARRLLHNKSEHPEAEKMMISRMQQELGKTFTLRFEGMFRDMTTSEELARQYHGHIKNVGAERQIDLGIHVLTSNNWPPEVMSRPSQLNQQSQVDCNYPPEITRLQESFHKFYLKDRSGRVLRWVGSAGNADMKCVFPKVPGHDKGPLSKERRYELNVPTYGMVVLMLFNDLPDGASLSLEEIQASTAIPTGELVRALASLSIPLKSRVLLKTPQSKQVKAGDSFAFNGSFQSRAIRIKAPVINAVSKVEGDEERKATEEKNSQTRAHIVDAAIVRILK